MEYVTGDVAAVLEWSMEYGISCDISLHFHCSNHSDGTSIINTQGPSYKRDTLNPNGYYIIVISRVIT